MLKAVIVDDEKDGRDALNKLIRTYCRNVEIVGAVDSVENAIPLIETCKPDILFLDIEMPHGSGFDLLRRLKNLNFSIIFITAHSHYAIKAFKFAAIDYLLKPIDIDDLTEAVKRVEKRAPSQPESIKTTNGVSGNSTQNQIALPMRDGLVYLPVPDIIRFEGDGSYTKAFVTDGKTYMISRNIKEYEVMLAENHFFRCHISHLVNLRHVKRFSRHDGYYADMSDGTRIEIARRKKDAFVERMNRLA